MGGGRSWATRLDNMENNSEKFFSKVQPFIAEARHKAKRNNEWMRSRGLMDKETGEILSDKEGELLTLEKMSKSWYVEKGARNNAFSIVKRYKKALNSQWDVKKYRPKMISLTFANIEESWRAERAIQKFLDNLRKYAKKFGVTAYAYFWAAEVQMKNGRGALHYHVVLLGFPYIHKSTLEGWWKFGFLDVRALDDTGRAFKYLAKYLWKWGKEAGDPDTLPDWWFLFNVWHKRRYGFSKWFALPPAERVPRWAKEILEENGLFEHLQKVNRAEGGGWNFVIDLEGEIVEMHLASPFKILELAS